MEIEQDRTVQALQVAIKMEIDGREFYLKASRESGNELGKKLLESLAAEEDVHRQNFEKIYNSIRIKQGWPGTDFQPDTIQRDAGLIDPFDAVHDRSAHQRDGVAILSHTFVGDHRLDGHGHIKCHDIARLPRPVQAAVSAGLNLCVDSLAVD